MSPELFIIVTHRAGDECPTANVCSLCEKRRIEAVAYHGSDRFHEAIISKSSRLVSVLVMTGVFFFFYMEDPCNETSIQQIRT